VNRQVKTKLFSFLTMTLVIVAPAFAQIPDGVSPGAADRSAEIEGRCPTFIWDSVPGAAFHELVGYRLPDDSKLADPSAVDLADADQVLYAKVSGSAPAWEPELAECLAPGGNYVWFVRAVHREEKGEVVDASEWSYGKYFSISPMPSAGEVEEALRVLRRHSGHQVDPEALTTERADTISAEPSRRVDARQLVPKSVTSAKAAIKGTVPDATGETYGVVGVSNSPNGAGVAAANTNGGADLVIDGSEDGQPDAVFTQAGIDRASSTEQWFSLINSDTGVLSLNVEGTIVGDGSGLTAVDAETLDGIDGADFATDAELTAHVGSALHNDTNAATICSNGYFLNGDGSCDWADGSGSCGAGSVCTGGHTHPATQITAGAMNIGSNNYSHSTKTGYYHVPGGSFTVASNNQTFYQGSLYMSPNNGSGSDVFGTAPIDIPDGATITGVTGYYYDNGATSPNPTWFCKIRGRPLGSVAIITIADETTTINWVDSNTTVRQINSDVVSSVVNKSAYNYHLVAGLQNTDGTGNFRHYGCRVTYTYTNTNN
jgi:hypothetical protein